MSVRQRDAAETKAASSEALKGAISGGAKVCSPGTFIDFTMNLMATLFER